MMSTGTAKEFRSIESRSESRGAERLTNRSPMILTARKIAGSSRIELMLDLEAAIQPILIEAANLGDSVTLL